MILNIYHKLLSTELRVTVCKTKITIVKIIYGSTKKLEFIIETALVILEPYNNHNNNNK